MPSILMPDNNNTSLGPEIVGGVLEVASHLVGKHIVDSLRKNFTGDGKTQRGDFYMDRSRELLQTHLEVMDRKDRTTLRQQYKKATDLKKKLESGSDSRFQRFRLAIEYKRLSKETYVIAVSASNRAVDYNLLNQMDEAVHETDDAQSIAESLRSTHSNPFTDSHAVSSTLSDVNVGDLNQVDVEAYQSEVTGEAAVVLGLHRQDASTQHIVATFSPTVFLNTSTDGLLAETNSVSTFGEGEGEGEVYGAPSEVGE